MPSQFVDRSRGFDVEVVPDKEEKIETHFEENVKKHLKDLKYIDKAGMTDNCFDYYFGKNKKVKETKNTDKNKEDKDKKVENNQENNGENNGEENANETNRFFDNAKEIYNYYTDIGIFTQKMIENDIIKYILFSKNERIMLQMLSNPELFFGAKEKMRKIIIDFYDPEKSSLEEIDMKKSMSKVIEKAKERKESKRILKLIKCGLQNALFTEK